MLRNPFSEKPGNLPLAEVLGLALCLVLSLGLLVCEATPASASSNVWGKLFVKTDPPNADISFLRIKYAYKDGIILRQGTYIIKVDYPGYESMLKEVQLRPGVDNVVEISLRQEGEPLFAPEAESSATYAPQPEPLPAEQPSQPEQAVQEEDKRISLSEVGRTEPREDTAKPGKSESDLKAKGMLLQSWSYKKDAQKEEETAPEPVAEPTPVAPQPESESQVTQYPAPPRQEQPYTGGVSGQLGGEQTDVTPAPGMQDPWQTPQQEQSAALPPTEDPGEPPTPQELTQAGLNLTSAGDLENALHAFTLALQQQPDNQIALRGKAFCHYHLGDNDQAMADLNYLLARFPDDPLGFFHRGNVHLLNGDPEAALDDYNSAVALEQSLPDLYNGRGTAYFSLGRYQEAIQDYDRALSADPNYVDAYYNRGSALLKMEKHQLALDDFDRALKLKPDDAQAQQKRKQALRALNRY
jgi:Tfp pilus assembly protein PilF